MKSIFQDETRRELRERLARLDPKTPAQWGRMTAAKMVCHLTDSARMASGELAVASRWMPIRYPPLKQLLIYWIPMAKGLPTAPELTTRVPESWEADKQALQAAIECVAARPADGAWPEHPVFGPMSGKLWGALVYRHSDHHLRQFGV
jgi:hypothetical protein